MDYHAFENVAGSTGINRQQHARTPGKLAQDADVQLLADASRTLKDVTIPKVKEMLDNLQILPIDSESLTKVMHEHGINMRYLSHIAVLT